MFKKKRAQTLMPEKEDYAQKNKVSFGMKKKLLLSFISLVVIFCAVITLVLNSRSASFVEQQALTDIDGKLTVFELLLQEQEILLRSLADSMKMEMLSEMDSGDSGAIEKALASRHAAFRHNHNISRTRLYDPDLRLLCDAGDAGNFGSNGSNRPLLKNALGYGSGRVVSGFEFENNELILFQPVL